MQRLSIKKFLLIFTIVFFSMNLYANGVKNVLIINSYHKGFDWSDKIIKGMEEVFYKTNIDSNVLYMDSKRISSQKYYNKLKELYLLQLSKHKYDLVVAIDPFAYEFVLKYYKDLCTNGQPIYFIGLEQFSREYVKKFGLENKVSGMMERRAIPETIKMIPIIMPDIKKLYIINDKSANGDDSEPYIKEAIKEIGNKYKVEYIRSISFEDLKKKFSKFRKNEAIFFIRFYNDSTGKLNKNYEIASFIENVKLPVFITDDLFIHSGAFGGKLVNIKQLGRNSAKVIMKILKDPSISPIIETDLSYSYVFDYKKAKEFFLSPEILHKEFVYVNAPVSFFDKYRKFIDFVFILSPFLLFLTLGLLNNLYHRIRNAKKLKQRMEFDKVLLNSVQSPILWQDQNGYIVDSNLKFKEFLELFTMDEKGRKLKDFIENDNVNNLLKMIKNLAGKNEIIFKSDKDEEYIFMINQTEYTENIFKTSGTVTVFTDVTKEKAALKEKMKHQEFIVQQSKLAEIGEIFSSIAHQWKSPLVEIATIAQEQIYKNGTQEDEENSQYVNDIMFQVRYMTETINDFQDFIRPSNQKIVFDIYESVVRMMEIVRHNIKYNYIRVNINVAKNCNLNILGYKNELMQTLLNVVNNAKDAIIKNKKANNIKKGVININIKNVDNYVLIEIEDNGGGISKEHINNVFEPYYTTKESGHGIGLYMAKLIIEDKMGGVISVINTDMGAKFSIKLELNHEDISA
ncbi:ATP-binding protein [Malaciobacter molluscorum LMG 25693]|uniref:histidine kinase n=1 Tax=Malaciobacter molluscorum LMG 25693 TaxID=870501 RepID=A0A2G1DG96_9BACT|nr:ABC transporter substrate binding protein [Malaciobacter molluscorum]AXX93465.1 two-component system sensor histidine kinase [Malaciobacter molluscorum LMG 25693]PHO17521.1 ATP-binding protein [Malaciobacter molluscorum LMG 25693]